MAMTIETESEMGAKEIMIRPNVDRQSENLWKQVGNSAFYRCSDAEVWTRPPSWIEDRVKYKIYGGEWMAVEVKSAPMLVSTCGRLNDCTSGPWDECLSWISTVQCTKATAVGDSRR